MHIHNSVMWDWQSFVEYSPHLVWIRASLAQFTLDESATNLQGGQDFWLDGWEVRSYVVICVHFFMLSLYVLNAPLQDEEGGKVCSLIVGTFNSKMILHVGLNQKLSHPFGSCDSCRFIISNFKFGVEVQSYRRSTRRFRFFWSNDVDPSNHVNKQTYSSYYIMSTYSDLIVTHIFLAFILNYKPCHIPLEYRYPIKKSDYIKPNTLHRINFIVSFL